MRIYISIILIICFSISILAFDDNKYTITTCGKLCTSGGCAYRDCKEGEALCPGGGCKFDSCISPSCEGGLCVFEDCINATCEGGACNFIEPRETLKPGYCPGDGCSLDGLPHPKMDDNFLSA